MHFFFFQMKKEENCLKSLFLVTWSRLFKAGWHPEAERIPGRCSILSFWLMYVRSSQYLQSSLEGNQKPVPLNWITPMTSSHQTSKRLHSSCNLTGRWRQMSKHLNAGLNTQHTLSLSLSHTHTCSQKPECVINIPASVSYNNNNPTVNEKIDQL